MNNSDINNSDMNNSDMNNSDINNSDINNSDMNNSDMNNSDMNNSDMNNSDMNNSYMNNIDTNNLNNLLSVRNYLTELLRNDNYLNYVYNESSGNNLSENDESGRNDESGGNDESSGNNLNHLSMFNVPSIRRRRHRASFSQRNSVYTLLYTILGDDYRLDFDNHSLNPNLNNFINSTLYEKPVYKKIASDEGLLQLEDVIYNDDMNVNNNCPIFCTNFTKGQIISKMPCNHCFDSEAIRTWLKESNVCPVCRFELKYKEVKISSSDVSGEGEEIFNDNSSVYSSMYISNTESYAGIVTNMMIDQEEMEFQMAIMESLND